MDILPSFSPSRSWLVSIIMVLTLVLSGFVLVIGNDVGVDAEDGEDVTISNDVPLLAPGQRTGTHNLNQKPPEYMAYASEYYFGGVMEKCDINELCSPQTLRAVRDAAGAAIIAERHGMDESLGHHVDAHVLSIWIPYRSTEYRDSYETTRFARDTSWDEFLKAANIL